MSAQPALPGLQDIYRRALPNGAVLLARRNPASPSVTLSGSLLVGALFNPPEKLGLADFTASALLRGTHTRTMQAIYAALEGVGASLSFSGGTHTTGFHAKCLAEDLPLLLGLLVEALRQPTFPEPQVEKLRAQFLTGLALRDQDTGDRAGLAFDELTYPQHPYRFPDEGHPHTIRSITHTDLADFHALHYGPRGLNLALVGGIDPQAALDAAEAALGGWHNPLQPPPPVLPPAPAPAAEIRRREVLPGMSQSDIVLGTPGPMRAAPDYLATALANDVLGVFGMMGRIGARVRDGAGLAYYAGSSLGGSLGPGPWTVSAGVDPRHEEQAIELIKDEIRRLVSEPISASELADSQAASIGRLPLSLEANAGVAGALLSMEKHNLGLDYLQRYPGLIRAITARDALAAAQNYLHPERLAIAIAGPPQPVP